MPTPAFTVNRSPKSKAAIKVLKELEIFEKLPEKLLQAAKAREEHPVSPLSELAEMMDPPITKPAMNNRLKRLVQLAKEAKEAKA